MTVGEVVESEARVGKVREKRRGRDGGRRGGGGEEKIVEEEEMRSLRI